MKYLDVLHLNFRHLHLV